MIVAWPIGLGKGLRSLLERFDPSSDCQIIASVLRLTGCCHGAHNATLSGSTPPLATKFAPYAIRAPPSGQALHIVQIEAVEK